MADQCKEEVKAALQNKDLALAAEKAQTFLDELNNIRVNIAITGESGSGKSTLVNALRGIRNKTEGAAPTGVTETTMEPTEYLHPEMPNIKIWDLPGVGTTKFTADKYLEKMKLEEYDFIRDEKEENPNSTVEDVLKDVKNNCTKELQDLGFESPKIFLVSGFRLHLYGFKDLWKTLEEELPEHQRDALLLALPNISLDVIEQKKQTLASKIIWFTLASAAVAAVPIPGVSGGVDLSLVVTFTKQCVISLGLTPELLQKLSDVSGVPLKDIQGELKSPLAGVKITKDIVVKVLTSSAAYIAAMAVEEGVRFAPLVGIFFSMAISGATTYKALKYILEILTDDAQRVFTKSLGLSTSV